MKIIKIISTIVLSLSLGYLLGNFLPLSYLRPTVIPTQRLIQLFDLYQIIINFITAFVTAIAVLVALFKEDIRKMWEYPKLEISIPENNFTETLNSANTDTSNSREATKYTCDIDVFNSGNITALELEIKLESLIFTYNRPGVQNIEVQNQNINWGESETKINLPPECKRTINVVQLFAPEQQSGADGGSTTTIPAKLEIAGIPNKSTNTSGKWKARFAIFSTNAKPARFELEVDWDSEWEKRLTEMRNHFDIKIKK